MQTHGGFGFANEYDIERKFRETRLYQVAPISTNLIYAYVASMCSACRGPSDTDRRHARPLLRAGLASDVARLRQIGAI